MSQTLIFYKFLYLCNPMTLDISNYEFFCIISNYLSLKYQKSRTSGSIDIGIRKFEFVAKTQFLSFFFFKSSLAPSVMNTPQNRLTGCWICITITNQTLVYCIMINLKLNSVYSYFLFMFDCAIKKNLYKCLEFSFLYI